MKRTFSVHWRKYKIPTLVVISVLLLLGVSWAVYAIAAKPQSGHVPPTPAAKTSNTSKIAASTAPSTVPPTTPVSSGAPAPTAATPSSGIKSAVQGTAGGVPSISTNVNIPFAVNSVYLQNPTWYCSDGFIIVQVDSATVSSQGPGGGTFSWQVEAKDSDSDYTSTSRNTVIYPNSFSAILSNESAPGFLFSDSYGSPGEMVRVRVTSPNSVSSSWYTVPASASCPR
jgi:hypothetical protein